MKTTSARSSICGLNCQCPVYATPFTAELIRGKLGHSDLQGRVKLIELPMRRQLRDRAL